MPNAGRGDKPVIKAIPTKIKTMIATTFIKENQYSNSPKFPTRRDFCSNGDDLNQSVSGANGEARPAIQITLGVNAERACDGMDNRHLRQHVRHDQRENRPKEISENNGRPRETDGDIAPQEQADTDGAADSNHGELALG